MALQSIDGKYFIVLAPTSDGGGQRLWRGRIVGQAVSDLIPVFLCDIWPTDLTDPLQIRSQTLLPLEQLVQGWLYDDRQIWEIEFKQIVARMEKALAAAKAEVAKATRAREKMAREIGQRIGVTADTPVLIVDEHEVDAAAETIADLVERAERAAEQSARRRRR